MRIVFAGNNTSSHAFKDDEGCNKGEYKKYGRIDHNAQETAVFSGRLAFGGRIISVRHTTSDAVLCVRG